MGALGSEAFANTLPGAMRRWLSSSTLTSHSGRPVRPPWLPPLVMFVFAVTLRYLSTIAPGLGYLCGGHGVVGLGVLFQPSKRSYTCRELPFFKSGGVLQLVSVVLLKKYKENTKGL